MIKEYSKSKNGNENISKDFKIKEFACKDGTDKILIDHDLIPVIQRFREYVEAPVTINSAYRTSSYNKKVGGASNSYHLYGRALDISFNRNYKYLTNKQLMGSFFYTLKVKGIIEYSWGFHIDTRSNIYHKKDVKFSKINIPLYVNLSKGDKNNNVGVLQFMLKQLGYSIEVDCIFGSDTDKIVREFQKTNNLDVDGIVGQKTWQKIISK